MRSRRIRECCVRRHEGFFDCAQTEQIRPSTENPVAISDAPPYVGYGKTSNQAKGRL